MSIIISNRNITLPLLGQAVVTGTGAICGALLFTCNEDRGGFAEGTTVKTALVAGGVNGAILGSGFVVFFYITNQCVKNQSLANLYNRNQICQMIISLTELTAVSALATKISMFIFPLIASLDLPVGTSLSLTVGNLGMLSAIFWIGLTFFTFYRVCKNTFQPQIEVIDEETPLLSGTKSNYIRNEQ